MNLFSTSLSRILKLAAAFTACSFALSAAGTTVFAGGVGVLKSTDGGLTWVNVSTGLGTAVVDCIAVDPTNSAVMYAGSNAGAFKSTDGGWTWTAISNGLNLNFAAVVAIVIDPTNTSTLYAATGVFGHGVFKSIDGGTTWTSASTGLTTNGSLSARALIMDPTDHNTLYVGGDTGLLMAKTTNGAASWSNLTGAPPFTFAMAINPVTPLTVYAAGPFGISKSTDGGATWSFVSTGLTNSFAESLALDQAAPSTLYAGTGGGNLPGIVYKTSNAAGLWASAGVGITGNRDMVALAIDPTNDTAIFAGGNLGVFKSSDSAGTWSLVLSTAHRINALAIAPTSTAFLAQNLVNGVQALGGPGGPLNGGQVNALIQKLNGVINDLSQGKTKTACNQLNAFVNQVNSLVTQGILSPTQGAALLAQAQSVAAGIPCQ